MVLLDSISRVDLYAWIRAVISSLGEPQKLPISAKSGYLQ
jgi:hypothetical protein